MLRGMGAPGGRSASRWGSLPPMVAPAAASGHAPGWPAPRPARRSGCALFVPAAGARPRYAPLAVVAGCWSCWRRCRGWSAGCSAGRSERGSRRPGSAASRSSPRCSTARPAFAKPIRLIFQARDPTGPPASSVEPRRLAATSSRCVRYEERRAPDLRAPSLRAGRRRCWSRRRTRGPSRSRAAVVRAYLAYLFVTLVVVLLLARLRKLVATSSRCCCRSRSCSSSCWRRCCRA